MKTIKLLVIILTISFLSSIAYVSLFSKTSRVEKIAKIKLVKGTVLWYKKHSRKKIRAKIGSTLPINSIVETKRKSKAVLYLKNN